MIKPILIAFRHDDKAHSMVIRPTEADWWTAYGGFDIHYCEDYNEICVYQSQDYSTTIHTQKIKEKNNE